MPEEHYGDLSDGVSGHDQNIGGASPVSLGDAPDGERIALDSQGSRVPVSAIIFLDMQYGVRFESYAAFWTARTVAQSMGRAHLLHRVWHPSVL